MFVTVPLSIHTDLVQTPFQRSDPETFSFSDILLFFKRTNDTYEILASRSNNLVTFVLIFICLKLKLSRIFIVLLYLIWKLVSFHIKYNK